MSDGECSNSKTDTLVLFDQPIAFAGNDTSVCGSNIIQIGSQEILGNTYSWTPSTGINNSQIARPFVYPNKGFSNYMLKVSDTATGCVATDIIYITASDLLQANVANGVSICRNDEVKIGVHLYPDKHTYGLPLLG